MTPTRASWWFQVRRQIAQTSMPTSSNILNPFYLFFQSWWIWARKMRQIGTNIELKFDVIFEGWFIEKSTQLFIFDKTLILKILGGPTSNKYRIKHHSKFEAQNGMPLSINLHEYWLFWGGKLGGKVEPRTNKKQFKHASNKWWTKVSCRSLGGASAAL